MFPVRRHSRAALLIAFVLSSCSGEDKETEDPVGEAAPVEEAPVEEAVPVEEAPVEEAVPVEEVVVEPMSAALKSTLSTIRPEQRVAENPLAGQEAAVSEGAEDFITLCAHCHGKDGKGQGPASKSLGVNSGDLTLSQLTPGERFEIMKSGVAGTPMQSFRAAMSDKQMWSLIAHMDSLRPAYEGPAEAPSGEAAP
jgi:cytochrome c553